MPRRSRRGARRGWRGSGSRAAPGTPRTGPRVAPVSIWTRSTSAMSAALTGHHPGDHVAVPAKELGRRLGDQVRPELERPADVRRGERVVDDVHRAVAMGQLGESRVVGEKRRRVGDGLGVQDAGRSGIEGGRHRVEVGRVDEIDLDAEAAERSGGAGPGSSRTSRAERRCGRPHGRVRPAPRGSPPSPTRAPPRPRRRPAPRRHSPGRRSSGSRCGCRHTRRDRPRRPARARRRRPRRTSRSGRSGRWSGSARPSGPATPRGWRASRSLWRRVGIGVVVRVCSRSDATPARPDARCSSGPR